MINFLTVHYLWIKAFHLIFVTFWMAGLFYLPRLFAYHATVKWGSESDKLFQVMERRLSLVIITPAMTLALFFGVLLLFIPGLVNFHEGWLHLKLFCVLLLLGFHGYLAGARKRFFRGSNTKSNVFYRKINEIPPIIFLIIVFMVILKPF